MKERIEKAIRDSIKGKEALLKEQSKNIENAAAIAVSALKAGGKILVFGNGGSASDSQHMAAELVGRFGKERSALPAIALTADTSILTAIGNDYGFDKVFSRQVEAHGKKGDVAIGISTSGNSRNVIEALKTAKTLGLKTIGLAGKGAASIKNECDCLVSAGQSETPRIQESHILIIHIICSLIEEEMFK